MELNNGEDSEISRRIFRNQALNFPSFLLFIRWRVAIDSFKRFTNWQGDDSCEQVLWQYQQSRFQIW